MKVLVLGGTGNISRAVVGALMGKNYEVVLFTRGLNPDPPPAGLHVITGDRRNRDNFKRLLDGQRFDYVIDMICFDLEDAKSDCFVFRDRVEHFIHCSTVMTYGPPFPGVYLDESSPLNGNSNYSRNKIAADEYFLRKHQDAQFPVTILKPSLTFGANVLLPQIGGDGSWIDRLRKYKPLLSAGDGQNYFQFLPSKDAGLAFSAILGRKASIGQVYNLVHPNPRTWDHWHQEVAESLEVDLQLVHVPQDLLIELSPSRFGGLSDNFGHTQIYEGSKLGTLIPEFQPCLSLISDIRESIDWMDRHRLIPDSDGKTVEDRIIHMVQRVPDWFRNRVQQVNFVSI